jgi:ubiquinone/menaquinone biosynthesis C-methylase UbiE
MSSAGKFFDSISDSYKKKYSEENIFHYYFFTERLEKSTKDISLSNKKILDLGSGTGDLYDFIKERAQNITYTGTDIAEGMLKNSSIPEGSKFLGDYITLKLPYNDYDLVFMLGVSTYLSEEEMNGYLNFISQHTKENDATIVISFTNKYCFDNLFRSILKPIILLIPNKKNVLSQKIKIKTYSINEVQQLLVCNFRIENVEWLNHTIFPFNIILKNFSVYLAKKIDVFKNEKFLSLFSSDFVIKAKVIK